MRMIGIAAAAALVSACGNSGQEAQAEAVAAALQPGEYELGWTDIKRTDADKKGAGEGASEAAATFADRTCIAAGGKIEPAAFAEKGDDCHAVQSYVRNGIVNVQLTCERKDGKLSSMVTGKFTAESLDADVETTTSFEGKGNYTLTRKVTAKRIGDCPATAETATAGEASES